MAELKKPHTHAQGRQMIRKGLTKPKPSPLADLRVAYKPEVNGKAEL